MKLGFSGENVVFNRVIKQDTARGTGTFACVFVSVCVCVFVCVYLCVCELVCVCMCVTCVYAHCAIGLRSSGGFY